MVTDTDPALIVDAIAAARAESPDDGGLCLPPGIEVAPYVGPRCAGTELPCDELVPKRGDYCAPCAAKNSADFRAVFVADARRSLPAWPWARFGPELLDAITRGKPGTDRQRTTTILNVAHTWRREHRSLVLLGPTGAGKTVAAVAILHRILDRATDRPLPAEDMAFAAGVRFVEAKTLAEARREWPLGKGEPPAQRKAIAATLLVLDELGDEPQQDAAVPAVLDRRYKLERPTIITSGLTKEGLAQRYGDATKRRMTEFGQVVSMHGGGVESDGRVPIRAGARS